jgi:hypothetical protein
MFGDPLRRSAGGPSRTGPFCVGERRVSARRVSSCRVALIWERDGIRVARAAGRENAEAVDGRGRPTTMGSAGEDNCKAEVVCHATMRGRA